MRLNFFGDVYCHNVIELSETLEAEDCVPASVYLCEVMEPEDGEILWCGEIADDVTGDLICYIEANTPEEVRAMAAQVGIEDKS